MKYFRNGCLNRRDKLISRLFPGIMFSLNASKIIYDFSLTKKNKSKFEPVELTIEPYTGRNKTVLKISEYLKSKIKNDLVGVYVHGSIGTGEEIAYSDFDGLVILKNEVFADSERLKRVAVILKQSEAFMYEMDPLQHHGWFILTENDLENYPEEYFPHVLFRFTKCLFGATDFAVNVKSADYTKEFEQSYIKLSIGILSKMEAKSFLKNYYNLKNFLSECMLLPVFYLEAKSGKGIFKKESFSVLKNKIGAIYSVMDEISEIRSQWNYNPSENYLKALKKKSVAFNLVSPSKFSEHLPVELQNKFDDNFTSRLRELINFLGNQLYK